jgi:hypothetical protein
VIEMSDVREQLRAASASVPLPNRPCEGLVERRERKHRNQRVATAVVALAIAAGVAGGSLALLSGLERTHVGPGHGGEAPAASIPNLALPPDRFFYLKVASSRGADGWVRDEETWWATDGSGQIRNDGTRQDKYPQLPSGVYGPAKFPIERGVSGLSTDPTELAKQLGEGAFGHWLQGEPEPHRVWDAATTLLLDFPNATPDLRAALFEVASRQDGVQTIADAHDPAGRNALALELTSETEAITWTMYFDPETHQLMAWTSVYDGNPPAWVILDSGIVDSPGVRPTGSQWLFAPS